MNYLTILFAFCISLIYVMKIESSDMMHMTSGHGGHGGHGGGMPMVLIKQDGHRHGHGHKSDLFVIGGSGKCPPLIMKNSGKGKRMKKLILIPGDCKHFEEKKQQFIPYPVTVKEYVPVPIKQMHPIMTHDMHDNGMMGHSIDMGMHTMINMHGMNRKK